MKLLFDGENNGWKQIILEEINVPQEMRNFNRMFYAMTMTTPIEFDRFMVMIKAFIKE